MAKANILIVEDEAIIASVIAGALKKFDFVVQDILNSGEAAVTAALQQEARPDPDGHPPAGRHGRHQRRRAHPGAAWTSRSST